MSKPKCAIDYCLRDSRSGGWCMKHYQRWRAHGDPLTTLYAVSPEEAVARYAQPVGLCMIWQAPLDTGVVPFSDLTTAVRTAWTLANGPIPSGLRIAQVCQNEACVKVSHLRLARQHGNSERLGLRNRSTTSLRLAA